MSFHETLTRKNPKEVHFVMSTVQERKLRQGFEIQSQDYIDSKCHEGLEPKQLYLSQNLNSRTQSSPASEDAVSPLVGELPVCGGLHEPVLRQRKAQDTLGNGGSRCYLHLNNEGFQNGKQGL